MNEINRSVSRDQEFDWKRQLRDVRSPWAVAADILRFPRVSFGVLLVLAAVAMIFPASWPAILLLCFTLWVILTGRREALPFNLPFTAAPLPDLNSPKPGRKGYAEANASFYLGNDMNTDEELYLSFDALLRHMMVFGTTGAGKTETMTSFAANFLCAGSGLIFNDAKGTTNLAWLVYSLARWFGRDDDFLVKNYLTGNHTQKGDPAKRQTNDSAPFAYGSAEAGTQLIISLMPADAGGANKVFSESAIALMSSVMPALTELRDLGTLVLDPGVIRDYTAYNNYCKLLLNKNISERARTAMLAFIQSRSGFDSKKSLTKQPEEVHRQFGFAQAYFIRALSSLTDTYGHIFSTGAGEIDYRDVILQDRILVTILPAMEKSSEELNNLGKISLSAIRNALASGLGSEIEGEKETTLESLPTASNRPFGIFNDEYAFMMVSGAAITNAQARGLNVALIIGAQDYAGLKRANEAEAEQTVSNSRFKYIMSLNDAGATLDLVKRLAGEASVSMSGGYTRKDSGRYYDGDSARIERVERISPDDLKSLNMGEGFGIYMDKVVAMKNFHHGFSGKEVVDSYYVRRRVLADFRPTRGPMVEALRFDAKEIRSEIKIWADHLVNPRDNSDIPEILLIKTAVDSAKETPGYDALSKTERGLFMLGKLIEAQTEDEIVFEGSEEPGDDIGDKSTPALNCLAGTFGDDEATDEEILVATASVDSYIAALAQIEDTPPLTQAAAKELINETVGESDSDDFNNDEDASILNVQQRKVISVGIKKIERANGATEEQARSAGVATAQAASKATQFPIAPIPQKTDANKERLKQMVQALMTKGSQAKE